MSIRISELPVLAGADAAADDVLAIVDTSAGTTKKIAFSDVGATTSDDPDFTVDTGDLATRGTIAAYVVGRDTQGATPIASTSGSEIDFTGIPAAVQEVEVVFDEVSLSGSDDFLVQVGTSSGVVTTGYTSTSIRNESGGGGNGATSTSGLAIRSGSGAYVLTGSLYLRRLAAGSSVWVSNHNGKTSTAIAVQGGGRVELGAELDRVRITRTGTNTFDAGQVNVRWR